MNETPCRIGVFAIVLALGFIAIWAGREPVRTTYLCDVRTNNCYERLAMPVEKFK